MLHITVKDKGRGFVPEIRKPAEAAETARPASGLGLTGMAERVRLLGGTHTMRSSPGRGTTIEFRIPLPASPDTSTSTSASAHA